MWIRTLAQILLSNKTLQRYAAEKIIALLEALALKTRNKADDKVVYELNYLLEKLGYLDVEKQPDKNG